MEIDFETCKFLIERFRKLNKFEILEDDNPHGFGDGVDYWSYTILESANLKVIYARYDLFGRNDITVIDKEKNICIYSNSPYPEEFGIDKMERTRIQTLDELIRRVEERL
ncbi:hypothetical protein J4402_03975 [Candidatus Pacearchaeota archaeon]|nr:hypothetical protein [Candidatus Pacearchaeota archaeon]